MTRVDEGAVIVREGVLATSIEEAEAKAFEASSASLLDGSHGEVFTRDVEASGRRTRDPQEGPGSVADGPSPFQQRGL